MTAPRPLSAADRLDRLRLIRSENVGPVTFYELIRRFGSAGAALAALPELARGGGRRTIRVCARIEAERELAAVEAAGARLVANGEPEYPALLTHLDDAPPLLCLKGHAGLFGKPIVAVVGARNASLNGRRFAHRLASGLGEAGIVVASGLARGIDASAHEGALATGTVAAVAGGIDVVYPKENAALHAAIGERGALITEMPPATEPLARHFPRRNRLISGLSLGVVVVEAGLRSGSLITARLALEQGREVFAVPGSPLDPRARGPNDLLRQGATLVESAADVTAALSGLLRQPLAERKPMEFKPVTATPPDQGTLERARRVIEECLGPAPLLVDELIRSNQFSPAVVSLVLLELELAGRLERHPGNQVSLAGKP